MAAFRSGIADVRCAGQHEANIPELRSTQASIAVSADGAHWFLINASPDLRQQLIATPQLHPKAGQLRHSPIAGVILTNGEVDAVAGLLSMREGSPFTLYAHERVLAILRSNSIFNVLGEKNVKRQPIEADRAFEPALPDGSPSGMEVLPFEVPGKGAWYLEGKAHPAGGDGAGDTLGLRIPDKASGKYFYFLAACAGVTDDLKSRLAGAPLVFFDGTVWRDDELIVAGPRQQDGTRDGTYFNVGRPRRDREPCRPRYRPQAVPAYQQLQPGAARRLGRAKGRRTGRLADSGRWNGDRAVNVMAKGKMTAEMTALSIGKGITLNNADELEAMLRHIGATRYHNLHPFHRLLHGGKLNKGQVQAWALNRYFYQSTIPLKDAMVISRFRDRATRVEWRHRIEDHDGDIGSEGGIERWLKLTEGLGLDSAYVESTEGILPATRFAVEAYVHFCRDNTPLEAIASSLTELFAPNLHEERISGMLQHYDFVNPDIMSYFSRRLTQAPRDAGFALEYVKANAKTPAEREAVCNALIFKTNVLWVQLDALYHAYVEGHIPPGAFVPKGASDRWHGAATSVSARRAGRNCRGTPG